MWQTRSRFIVTWRVRILASSNKAASFTDISVSYNRISSITTIINAASITDNYRKGLELVNLLLLPRYNLLNGEWGFNVEITLPNCIWLYLFCSCKCPGWISLRGRQYIKLMLPARTTVTLIFHNSCEFTRPINTSLLECILMMLTSNWFNDTIFRGTIA